MPVYEAVCEACGNPIEAGQKYIKFGSKYFHSKCLLEEKLLEVPERERAK